jgi:TatD DNase family protein
LFIDSHCHLDRLDLAKVSGGLAQIIENAEAAKVDKMLCVSVTLAQFPQMLEKVAAFDNVFCSCGTHPLNQGDSPVDLEQLLACADRDEVIAIGETGLDYYYAPQTKALQLDAFVKHIAVARRLSKPLIIHTRDAREDTLNLLRQHQGAEVGGVLHCFTESWEMAKAALDMGFYISFSGIVTFKNAADLREVAKKVPADRILVETDAPYLAPVPHRGEQNQPAYVVEVARMLAELRGDSLEQFAAQTTANFHRLFQTG